MSLQVPREGLTQKLQKLSQTQQSIESVSSFCIFYHKDAKGVVQIWEQEFYKANNERKLALMYLANHILQEGRKKSLGFQEEYFRVLPKALAHMVKHGDVKHKKALIKCVTVWEERKVFGTRHMKSFKEVLGLQSEPKPAAAAAAAAGSNSTSTGTAAAKLGPVGDALLRIQQVAGDTTAKSQEFTSSWSQSLLATSGLPEVTAAQSKLAAYTAALQAELTARQGALNALNAELTKQTAEVSRIESQLQTVGAQKQQLDGRLTALTQAAMASLGQMFQQNGAAVLGAGAPAAAAGATAAAAGGGDGDATGSPQAPGLELEEDDDDAPAASYQAGNGAAAGTAAGGAMTLQSNIVQQQAQLVPPDLQALLANPHMLSAAIQSTQASQPAASATVAAAAAGSIGFGVSQGMALPLVAPAADGGVQLQLPSGPIGTVPPGAEGGLGFAAPPAAAPLPPMPYAGDAAAAGFGMHGGYMPTQQAGGYGGLAQLEQEHSVYADEADDPYDPEQY